jgi:UDP-N-acetylglucosamine 2-epimerase (non-hydrolysing)
MGAMAAFYRKIPVGHVEAGLRTGDPMQPFPEETNRRLISRVASWHFAATRRNRTALLREGVSRTHIFVTGNPVVDSLNAILKRHERSVRLQNILDSTRMYRRIAMTTHRRESFGGVLEGNLRVMREFLERQTDVALIFPVHPNPVVRQAATAILGGCERVWLTEPLDYLDFIGLLSESWLIVSDSGGIQEEAPSLGKRVLVLRDVTERPEAVESGVAKLVGDPERLAVALKEEYWRNDHAASAVVNPFGRGDSGRRIAQALWRCFHPRTDVRTPKTPIRN